MVNTAKNTKDFVMMEIEIKFGAHYVVCQMKYATNKRIYNTTCAYNIKFDVVLIQFRTKPLDAMLLSFFRRFSKHCQFKNKNLHEKQLT